MLSGSLVIRPYIFGNLQSISFVGKSNDTNPNVKEEENILNKRISPKRPPKNGGPTMTLPDPLYIWQVKELRKRAYEKDDISVAEYLNATLFKDTMYTPNVMPVDSRTAIVGSTKITSLIDGDQIFDKTLEFIHGASKSIQVEMFEFQNLSVDGDDWKLNGAGKFKDLSQKQYRLLNELIEKKESNPEMKIQVILDAHKWYINSDGRKKHYGNAKMIKFLKENGIDVVPYPRAAQQGAALQHVKFLAVDGQKAIIGGMNWGTHSIANHDACVALELPTDKNGKPLKENCEVDNLIEEIFNADWKFAWQRLGETKVIKGPLTKEEQKYYRGIDKEIKPENVEYMKLVGELYNNPTDKNRYKENRLELIKTNPIENGKISILATKPKELEKVGLEGKESIRNYIMERVKTCQSLQAELFVLTDKEIIKTLIARINKGELKRENVRIIIDPSIIEELSYCENGYDELMENDIPVRLYNVDESTNQRMHSKFAIFDDREVLIGSANWSAMGLNQNLGTGIRDDYDLNTEKIEKEIEESFKTVQEYEEEFGFPPFEWNGNAESYQRLKKRLAIYRKAENDLNKHKEANFKIDEKNYALKNDEFNTELSKIQTIKGYYEIIAKDHLSKESYKRGNNEMAIAFESPSLAKYVFKKQFERDWKYSKTEDD
ncbi:MAG: phospholipase D-like domain-containing protein [Candidatus Gastranaerophilaceae bacterium]